MNGRIQCTVPREVGTVGAGAGSSNTPTTIAVGMALGFTLFSGLAASAIAQAPVTSPSTEAAVRFGTDVIPVLTKLGCNSGGCHGKATGQNGFKLSLLGFDPDLDYRAIARQARGRRISVSAPDRSLLLAKAVNLIPHGGGKRTTTSSEEYQVLYQWMARGARPPSEEDPIIERIELQPSQATLKLGVPQPLSVRAFLSDGTSRDVTKQAMYESNEPAVATVSSLGLVEAAEKQGLVSVMVRYSGKVTTFHGVVPVQAAPEVAAQVQARLDELQRQLTSPIDQLLLARWRQLGITPSNEVDDATFIRRATLDICGTLPTVDEVSSYVADRRADKRERLIDRLLERPEYASYFALKWADILRNRGSGYSTRQQRHGTALFANWIRDSIAQNKPYDQFVSEVITASGSQLENPPTVWYRQVRTPVDFVESVAQAFLGVRIQCAQCHHHPFDRWSQEDYFGLAAVYARVGRKGGFADAEVPTDEVIYLKETGDVRHPRTGKLVPAKALGGPLLTSDRYDDPRQSVVHWMVDPDNPFFARTMANRMWAHFHGRGIVHPIDDARISNPPSHPELLDKLAREFADSGYDVKQLLRTICNSYSYRLSSTPNELNRNDTQSYARFYPRRMAAEVLLDAISQVLAVPTPFGGGPGTIPLGTRAIDLPDENVPASFLDVFGRPDRTSSCECERVTSPSLAQALTLINSAEIQRKLTHAEGYAARLASSDQPTRQQVEEIFVRLLARQPTQGQLATAVQFLEGENREVEAYRSLLWSLLATNEFMFHH